MEGKADFRPRKGRGHVLVNVGGVCIRADQVADYVEDPVFREYYAILSAWNLLEIPPHAEGFLDWPLNDYLAMVAMKAELAAWEKAQRDERTRTQADHQDRGRSG